MNVGGSGLSSGQFGVRLRASWVASSAPTKRTLTFCRAGQRINWLPYATSVNGCVNAGGSALCSASRLRASWVASSAPTKRTLTFCRAGQRINWLPYAISVNGCVNAGGERLVFGVPPPRQLGG